MAEARTQSREGFVTINVFVVEPHPGGDGSYENPHFLKRGTIPVFLLELRAPLLIDENEYEWVDACYDLAHHEVMAFVKHDPGEEKVINAAKALVPDIARYGVTSG
jgi:hypothetical protein